MNLFIPKIRISSSSFPKWYTTNIRHQIKCLQTLRKKYKSHPTDHNFNRIKIAEDNLKNCIQQAKANFEANLVDNFAFFNDPKILQHVGSITKSAFIPATVFFDDSSATQDIDKATLLIGTSTLSFPRILMLYLISKICHQRFPPCTLSAFLKKKSTIPYYHLTVQKLLALMELARQS